VTGVHVIDARTRESVEFRARLVFLCASAFESARILLNSRTAAAPNGLANASDQVGRNVMDHIKGAGADGQFDAWADTQVLGARPNGIYVPRFRNVSARHPDFVRGYQYQGGGARQEWPTRVLTPGIGRGLKQRLTELGPWEMVLNGFGEMLPNPKNRCTLHPTATDAWGIPVLHIECAWGPNELAMHKDMSVAAAEMLERAGATQINLHTGVSTPGNTNHEMGSARMGRDPKTSVLNGWNQAWEVPNLFITDGACMASSGNKNPSLTYMALTARACHYAVDELRRGNL
jgi:glucoside 3-dehydrogenase (cytochrome c) catalytic subunit